MAHPEEIFQLHQAILISKRWGFGHMDQVLARSQERTGLVLDALKAYFSRLSYGFDENLQKGLRLYFDHAARCGLLGPVGEFEMIARMEEKCLSKGF